MNPQTPPYAPIQEPPKKRKKWPWIVGGVLVFAIIGSVANQQKPAPTSSDSAPTTSATPAAEPLSQPPATQAPPPVAPEPAKPAQFGDGTHRVPQDVKPGTYKTDGPDGSLGSVCHWSRLKDTSGSFEAIIANGLPSGPTSVTIAETDGAFQTTGCKPWVAVS